MNLIVYGSLINKKELEKEGISLVNVELVKIKGFKRVFNQEPSYRFLASKNRAVLNIIKDEKSWFNAIVIKNLEEEYFTTLDEREKGYNRSLIEKENIKTYDGDIFENSQIYLGKEEKLNFFIYPNRDYLEICLSGVKTFGEDFFKDFLKTTYKNSEDGLTLI